jgi:hypothetical protein
MLGIICYFIKKFLSTLRVDSIIITSDADSSTISSAKIVPNIVNPSGNIDNKQIIRLGFMERDGQVPDDFNSMASNEIEELFLYS